MSSGRTIAHVAYAHLSARLDLITRFMPRLDSASPPRRWFFVDVPLGARFGLEVVQLHLARDRAARSDLSAWLEACRANGLITAASFADAPMVLDPAFFPNGRVPPFYITAMAAGSARAATLLSQSTAPLSEGDVAAEIAALYAALVPRRAERRRALAVYATWLERTAAGTVDESAQAPAHVDRTTLRAGLVARLAHTQAVRLRGPDYPGGLDREAALVRSLLS